MKNSAGRDENSVIIFNANPGHKNKVKYIIKRYFLSFFIIFTVEDSQKSRGVDGRYP